MNFNLITNKNFLNSYWGNELWGSNPWVMFGICCNLSSNWLFSAILIYIHIYSFHYFSFFYLKIICKIQITVIKKVSFDFLKFLIIKDCRKWQKENLFLMTNRLISIVLFLINVEINQKIDKFQLFNFLI